MPTQANAHVRERNRLIRRIVHRRHKWGLGRAVVLDTLWASAAESLSRYKWPAWWAQRQLGRYDPFGGYSGPRVQYRDVPAHIIHDIMCGMR